MRRLAPGERAPDVPSLERVGLIERVDPIHREPGPALNGAGAGSMANEPPGELIAAQVPAVAGVRNAHDPFRRPEGSIATGSSLGK